MRDKKPGGCLYGIIFVVALAASVLLITSMLNSVRSSRGNTMLEELYDRIGISGDESDSSSGTSGAGRTPADSGLSELPAAEAIRIEITEDKLRELLQDAMADSFPLTLQSLKISSDSTVSFAGTAERDKFIEMMEQRDSGIDPLQRLALRMAPEQITFAANVTVAYDAASGTVTITPNSMTLAEVDIPVSLLPDGLNEKLNEALTGFFESYGSKPTEVTLYEGYMRVYFE
jgi:hypothetical protein